MTSRITAWAIVTETTRARGLPVVSSSKTAWKPERGGETLRHKLWWRVYLFFQITKYGLLQLSWRPANPWKKKTQTKRQGQMSHFLSHDMPWLYVPLRTATVAALVLMLIGQTLKPGRNSLLCLYQEVQQVFGYVAVFVIKKWCGKTCLRHRREVSIIDKILYCEIVGSQMLF